MNSNLIRAIQVYEARSAITPSALRGRSAGTVGAAREFLAELSLDQFATTRELLFQSRLDTETETLRSHLPKADRFWGVSRKCLNIFLRNVFYNSYLNTRYRLHKAEVLFELPLDSIVAKALRAHCVRGLLPRWDGVMHLQPDVSQKYQLMANRVASLEGVARVHLDAFWWGGDRVQQVPVSLITNE